MGCFPSYRRRFEDAYQRNLRSRQGRQAALLHRSHTGADWFGRCFLVHAVEQRRNNLGFQRRHLPDDGHFEYRRYWYIHRRMEFEQQI